MPRTQLPSMTGSPRNMHQNYYDAMAIVARFGKPDYFITISVGCCSAVTLTLQRYSVTVFNGQTPALQRYSVSALRRYGVQHCHYDGESELARGPRESTSR